AGPAAETGRRGGSPCTTGALPGGGGGGGGGGGSSGGGPSLRGFGRSSTGTAGTGAGQGGAAPPPEEKPKQRSNAPLGGPRDARRVLGRIPVRRKGGEGLDEGLDGRWIAAAAALQGYCRFQAHALIAIHAQRVGQRRLDLRPPVAIGGADVADGGAALGRLEG